MGGKNLTKKHVLLGQVQHELDLLERHVMMLNVIIENEPIGIIRLSELTRFPHHKVRYSLRILEEEGLVRPSRRGAITTNRVKKFAKEFHVLLKRISEKASRLEQTLKPR